MTGSTGGLAVVPEPGNTGKLGVTVCGEAVAPVGIFNCCPIFIRVGIMFGLAAFKSFTFTPSRSAM